MNRTRKIIALAFVIALLLVFQNCASGIQLIENKKIACGAVNAPLTEGLIDRSVFQNEIIGFNEGIFENERNVPTSIPANLVEVWCKDTNDRTGYETITHVNRTPNQEAVTRIYYTGQAGSPKTTLDFSSPLIFSRSRVNVVAGAQFSLEVRRDQPASLPGVFNRSVKMVLGGHDVAQLDTKFFNWYS